MPQKCIEKQCIEVYREIVERCRVQCLVTLHTRLHKKKKTVRVWYSIPVYAFRLLLSSTAYSSRKNVPYHRQTSDYRTCK